jgi:hypothetical protein
MDLMNQPQSWYFAIGALWSVFQGVRGVVETKLTNPHARAWKPWERVVVLYIHDFVFRLVCTLAGFVSLYMSIALFNEITPDSELSIGDALLMFLTFLVGVIGVGGQLHYVILLGKWPSAGNS